MRAWLLTLLVVLPAAADEPLSDTDAEAKAKALMQGFDKALQALATDANAQPVDAGVEYFAKGVPKLFAEVPKKGVKAGWTSLELRNPKNAAPPWVREVLRDFKMAPPGSAAFKAVTLDDGRRGYVQAIWMRATCVVCHGDPIGPVTQARINQRYPADQAKGYWLNDLRGAWWVELSR